jgi:hypothetical protein
MLKGYVVAYFKVGLISQHFCGGTKKLYEKLQLGFSVSSPEFESGMFR